MFKKSLFAVFALWASLVFAADANKASVAELDAVKGIGPTLSANILEERKKGEFKDWPDFVGRVKGVGDARAAKLSAEGLTVNGKTFVAAPAAKVAPKK